MFENKKKVIVLCTFKRNAQFPQKTFILSVVVLSSSVDVVFVVHKPSTAIRFRLYNSSIILFKTAIVFACAKYLK